MTVREMLENALRNIGVCATGQSASADDMDIALVNLNALMDQWNAEGFSVFGSTIYSFTMTSGTDSYTIDTSAGTWASQRPQEVFGCFLDDHGELRLIDEQKIASLRITSASGAPTDLWYDPEYPLGKLEFYPKPDANYTGKLHYRTLFTEITHDTSYNDWAFPPGYQSAINWCLSEWLQVPFSKQPDQMISKNANLAIRTIKSKNAADRVAPANLSFLNKVSTRTRSSSSSYTIFTG